MQVNICMGTCGMLSPTLGRDKSRGYAPMITGSQSRKDRLKHEGRDKSGTYAPMITRLICQFP